MQQFSSEQQAKKIFPVVGIGASAGGVEAVTGLFEHIPPDTGMAFVYIQHLAPKQESMLTEIIGRSTKMPVLTAKDNVRVEPDHVYVIPPATTITIENYVLKLKGKSDMYHFPIDSFFISLAQQYKTKAIGIVLSGTGTDGTEGLRAIYAEGGLTIVQKAELAKYSGMPSSAMAQGVVHFALSLEEIGKNLLSMSKHPYLKQDLEEITIQGTEEKGYIAIISMLKLKFGVDFSNYKESTISRRVSRRMLIHKTEKIPEYIVLLQKDPNELKALFDDLLIGVTHFFREPETFEALKKVLPQIIKQKTADAPLRIWVPGCATGEEAYSIAIELSEYLEKASITTPFQVFGTDLNSRYIEKARAGVYTHNISQYVSEERLRHFFHKINGDYQVSKLIRDGCIFSTHDITRDPPFSNLDIIFCRNLLIYLKPESQERVLRLFHYGLKRVGFLVLGHSESIGKSDALFRKIGDSIYSKKEVNVRTPINFEVSQLFPAEKIKEKKKQPFDQLQKALVDLMMARYNLASVVINPSGDVLFFESDLSPYIQITPGEANLNLFNIIKTELRVPVQTALIRAKKEQKPIKQEGIPPLGNTENRISIEVMPIKGDDGNFAVFFEKSTALSTEKDEIVKDKKAIERNDAILQTELEKTKEALRSVVEDHEATTEELRAALEEVQSGNEELQSTNEELETAKEELQSVNEELSTVNRELVDRNDTLNRLNDDLTNLFTNVNMAVIVLDNNARIRFFTPLAGERFNLLSTDLGRLMSDIRLKIEAPDIAKLAIETMRSLASKELKVTGNKHTYLMRVSPYITLDKKINGVVFSFIDVDPSEQPHKVKTP